jgi:uncharacterized ion transporter superfamily protein YfcC
LKIKIEFTIQKIVDNSGLSYISVLFIILYIQKKEDTEALVVASKENEQEENADKTRDQNAG